MIVFMSFVLFALFCLLLFGHTKEKRTDRRWTLGFASNLTHAPTTRYLFPPHWKTITSFIPHKTLQIQKMLKKDLSLFSLVILLHITYIFWSGVPDIWSSFNMSIPSEFVGRGYVIIYCIYMSMSIVIGYELMLGRWMFTSSFSDL